MEMASWDGGISRTVQFLVPQVCYLDSSHPSSVSVVIFLADIARHTAVNSKEHKKMLAAFRVLSAEVFACHQGT